MYCPTCAAQNDDARFCRSCGTNLSLIPQAISGQLADSRRRGRRDRGRRPDQGNPASLQSGITGLFIGLGFLIAALALTLSGEHWGIFLLIPGFPNLGIGVAAIVGAKYSSPVSAPPQMQVAPPRMQVAPPPPQVTARQAPATGELYDPASRATPPPSVTEGTTRIMNQAPETFGEKA
ncbi:MAG TPA: zinc ribbon domain-containing protein [Blastocatellia bacterium]|nr:zinc ribbon domain-containing protein [Blastocatellia bacterium]